MNVRPLPIGSSFAVSKKVNSRWRHHHSRLRKREAAARHRDRPGNGTIRDDGTRVPLDVKPYDLILFGRYASQDIKLDGEELLIMRETDVLAVLEMPTTNESS